MNLDIVLMCAHVTARQQLSAYNYVSEDVQALIAEIESLLAPAPVVEAVEEEPQAPETPAAV
jgi:hypothetical protein